MATFVIARETHVEHQTRVSEDKDRTVGEKEYRGGMRAHRRGLLGGRALSLSLFCEHKDKSITPWQAAVMRKIHNMMELGSRHV